MMVHIFHVEPELVLPAQRVAAGDLGQAGETGPNLVPTGLLGRVTVQVLHEQGPGTDQRDVASDDVPQGGQLVDAGRSQPVTQWCHPRGVISRPAGGVILQHRTELDHDERLCVQSWATLLEEHRAAQAGPDDQRRCRLYGQCQDEQWNGDGDVRNSFDPVVSPGHQPSARAVLRIFRTRSMSSSGRAEPLGSATPRSKSRSDWPLMKERRDAKTGCRCMGFHRRRDSMSSPASYAMSCEGVTAATAGSSLMLSNDED